MENAQLALQSDTMKSRAAAIQARSVHLTGNSYYVAIATKGHVQRNQLQWEKRGGFFGFVPLQFLFWTLTVFRPFPTSVSQSGNPGQALHRVGTLTYGVM